MKIFKVLTAAIVVMGSSISRADLAIANWSNSVQDNFGHCFLTSAETGLLLNDRQAVGDEVCERVLPSHYVLSDAYNRPSGQRYCFQVTPNGLLLNQGLAVDISYCVR